MSYPTVVPSALSVLLSRHADGAPSGSPSPTQTQKTDRPQHFDSLTSPEQAISIINHDSADRTLMATSNVRSQVLRFVSSPTTETTPLLPPPNGSVPAINGRASAPSKRLMSSKRLSRLKHGIIGQTRKIDPTELACAVLKSLPAVLLGTLLNILDGVSCKSI
jgi:SulP family sulfate permease